MSPSTKARPFDSWDALKILALFLMFIDHSGHFIFTDDKWLRAIGRGAAPIFLFLAGRAASYRFKGDLLTLAALMSISNLFVAGGLRPQNILFTILGCRMIFAWFERRGRKIERPWEWYIGSVALFMSVFITQYASFGLLMAISGYLQRRKQYYPPKLPQRFLIASIVTYGCYSQIFSPFSLPDLLLMMATLYGVWRVLDRFSVHEISGAPPWLLNVGKWVSYYSGYIYAFHLIALEWLTGIPF